MKQLIKKIGLNLIAVLIGLLLLFLPHNIVKAGHVSCPDGDDMICFTYKSTDKDGNVMEVTGYKGEGKTVRR